MEETQSPKEGQGFDERLNTNQDHYTALCCVHRINFYFEPHPNGQVGSCICHFLGFSTLKHFATAVFSIAKEQERGPLDFGLLST